MKFLLVTFLAAAALVPSANLYGRDGETTVRGDVFSDSGVIARNDLILELRAVNGAGGVLKVPVSPAGEFQISGVPHGQYQVRLTDLHGNVIAGDFVVIGESTPPIRLRIPRQEASVRPNGTISVARLRHRPPRAALKEIEKAQKAEAKGELSAALEAVRKAVAIDPDCIEARNNLAAVYVRMGRPEQALEHLEAAVNLDPSAALVQTNLAAVLLQLSRNEAGEQAARRAVELDGSSSKARYLLSAALARENKFTNEAMDSLRRASDEVPQARITAAYVYARTGRTSEARRVLTAYLSDPKAPARNQAEELLASLAAEGGH